MIFLLFIILQLTKPAVDTTLLYINHQLLCTDYYLFIKY